MIAICWATRLQLLDCSVSPGGQSGEFMPGMKRTDLKCKDEHHLYTVDEIEDMEFYVCVICFKNYIRQDGELRMMQ